MPGRTGTSGKGGVSARDGARDGGTQAKGPLKRIVLIGNPNVGKSVIFGFLTGRYVTVSNYPGTTVEVSSGNMSLGARRYIVVDTPGVNNLLPMSEDERVTRDILLSDRPELVVQVGDMKNLKRTLSITIQLAEMGLPVVLDLNMEDEAMDSGIRVDKQALAGMLGVPVLGTVAPERRGLKELTAAISAGGSVPRALSVNYRAAEEYIEKIASFIPRTHISGRSIALMVLAGDKSLAGWLKANLEEGAIEAIEAVRDECALKLATPPEAAGEGGYHKIGQYISEARLRKVSEITAAVLRKVPHKENRLVSILGKSMIHPLWGFPFLLMVLFGLYEFVGVLGAGTFVDFLERVIFGRYLNPMFIKVFGFVPVPFIRDMFVGRYGVITMALSYSIAIVLPITSTFFIAFSILEDSGYLPRLAIMTNRFFKMMGLSGKAVLPMVLGLGCGTMAVMTTRILESRRDRLIAIFLLSLAVPCSAQLGVILGMLSSLSMKAVSIWLLCVVGIMLVAGRLAASILPGERSDFFIEIPPLRKPAFQNVALKTANRVVWYLKEAVPLFILGTLVLFGLDKLNLLGLIERAASPVVVGVLGLPRGTAEAFIVGFLRRDYGAAGLFAMHRAGLLTDVQSLVSIVTITLFVPCLASFFIIIKEKGMGIAVAMMAIITPAAIIVGGILNWALRYFRVSV
ncbi:MAG: ferrous iron transport protein B [Nitrospiraceae bacterium]|nr:ferrous iron transport protein B [Nitrospiraceae bacterium]